MNRSRVVLMLLAVAGTVVSANAWGADFNKLCQVPEAKPGHVRIKIDANSASVEEGVTLQPDSRVEAVFINKNPFKYQYRFGLSARSLDEERIAQYLNGYLFKESPAAPAVVGPPAIAGAPPCGPGVNTEKDVSAFEDKLQKIQDLGKAYTKLLEDTDGESLGDEKQCVTTLQQASTFVTAVRTAETNKELDAAGLTTELGKLDGDVSAMAPGTCKDALKDRLDKVRDFKPKLEELQKASTVIGNLLEEDELIHARRYATVPSTPALVEAQVFRTNLRQKDAKEQSMGRAEFKAGEGRVTITAGAMYSNLDSRQVVRQPTLLMNEDGTSRVGARFGYSEESSFTVAPVVLLNVRVLDPNWAGGSRWVPPVHLAAGVLAAEENGRPRADFIAGLSFSFVDLVYLTAGAHLGEREQLVGFSVGDPVPADLLDPLPTTRSWTTAFTLALTFKLR